MTAYFLWLIHMNKTQRNFKKQMQKTEYSEHKLAKKNKGVFSNELFKIRFYGYKGEYKKKRNVFTKLLFILLRLIRCVLIAIIPFIIFLLVLAILF